MLLLHVTVHSFALRLAIFRYNYKRTPEKEGYEYIYIYKDNHRHVFIRDTQICGRNIFYPTNPRLHFLR